MEKIKKIISQFAIDGEVIDIKSNNSGNINKTYVVTYKMNDGEIKKYVFQKINTTVFKEPYKLMKNVENVTNWIENKIITSNINRPFLKLVPTKDGDILAKVKDETDETQFYRAYNYIDNSISYDVSSDKKVVYNTGCAFGNFQKLLEDYPIESLEDTIPDFHNTKKRYAKFLKDVELDACKRVSSAAFEIEYAKSCSDSASIIVDLMDEGKIPCRVTHNDTKVNNVMMDKDTGDYLTVIDLDTVMKGSLLYDYADGIRSAAASAFEDEEDLTKVFLRTALFESFTEGFLEEVASTLTKEEVAYMAKSVEIITYELAIRFLNDYINGDTYFKTNYDKHNLVRARNQLKLLIDIKDKMKYMEDFIFSTYKQKIKNK